MHGQLNDSVVRFSACQARTGNGNQYRAGRVAMIMQFYGDRKPFVFRDERIAGLGNESVHRLTLYGGIFCGRAKKQGHGLAVGQRVGTDKLAEIIRCHDAWFGGQRNRRNGGVDGNGIVIAIRLCESGRGDETECRCENYGFQDILLGKVTKDHKRDRE